MAKGKSAAKKSKRTARKTAQPKRGRGSGVAAARDHFAKGVMARGEAARPDASGKLPAQATHVIVDEQDGTCTVKRARFKLY